jgi:glycine betaine/proline transport system substrate-binding protein
MTRERIESPKLARIFLKEHPEVWHAWVDDAVASKIQAAL